MELIIHLFTFWLFVCIASKCFNGVSGQELTLSMNDNDQTTPCTQPVTHGLRYGLPFTQNQDLFLFRGVVNATGINLSAMSDIVYFQRNINNTGYLTDCAVYLSKGCSTTPVGGCYCTSQNNQVYHLVYTDITSSIFLDSDIRIGWDKTDGSFRALSNVIKMPPLYDITNPNFPPIELTLTVNGQKYPISGQFSGHCSFILVAKQANKLELTPNKAARPCYLWISSSSGSVQSSNNGTDYTSITVTPANENVTTVIEIAYSMCVPGKSPLGSCVASIDSAQSTISTIAGSTSSPASVATHSPPVSAGTPSTHQDFLCHLTSMTVFIPDDLVPNSVLSLKDPACQLKNNGTHHVISFSYDQCGTSQTFYTDYIEIKNEINVHSTLQISGPVVFAPDYTIPVQCSVPRHETVNGSFQAQSPQPVVAVGQHLSSFDLKEYRDELYQDEITQYPVTIPMNREIFLELAMQNAQTIDIGMKVNECKATPSTDPDDPTNFLLISNGCSASPAVHVQPQPSIDRFRFSVQAFHFSGSVNHNNLVYIHCTVTDCRASSCSTSCTTKRRRRSPVAGPFVTLTSGANIVLDSIN